ncbi:hypothetical protein Bca52824_019586 [Brassica carinata]|uniref:Uncharacterized protein n=1 Tax=Brassica carinata TaxID=52824 RepID=A0A8X8AXJ3_BRACI|nr:hypothetical protein Bca52824_019586 [Brassica carinata]
MSFMQQDSIGANKELCDYLKKARTEFTEHTIASAESITVMDHYLGLKIGVKNLNTKYQQELNVTMGDMAKENDKLQDEFSSTFSTLDANFVTRTNELHSAVNDSLMQDRENKEATDAILETSMKQVTLLQEKHGQAVSKIRDKAEQSLTKDYQIQNTKNCRVDQRENETPKKLAIIVPSLRRLRR